MAEQLNPSSIPEGGEWDDLRKYMTENELVVEHFDGYLITEYMASLGWTPPNGQPVKKSEMQAAWLRGAVHVIAALTDDSKTYRGLLDMGAFDMSIAAGLQDQSVNDMTSNVQAIVDYIDRTTKNVADRLPKENPY